MKDNELDELFRGKLKNREFEFNPRNWQAMESMLEEPVKNSGFFVWSSALIIGFGLLVSGTILVNRNNQNIADNPVPVVQQNIITTPIVDHSSEEFDDEALSNEESSTSVQEITTEAPEETSSSESSETENIAAPKPADNPVQIIDVTETNGNTTPALTTLTDISEVGIAKSETPWISSVIGYKDLPVVRNDVFHPQLQVPAMEENEFRPSDPSKYRRQRELWFEAGPDFSLSNANSPTTTSWFAGISFRYRLTNVWSVNAGLNYFSKRSPGIYLTSDSIFYNFGQEVIRTEVENQRLDYLSIPLEVSYDLTTRHQLSAGAYVGVLLNVQRSIRKTRFHYKGENEVRELKANGQSVNFHNVDYGLSAGYNFQYNAQFGIGLQLKYGLTDITRDRMDVLNEHHQNINARLVLRYRIF